MADTQFGKNGWTPERIGSLKGRTYLITGASSGTGFEAAKILASKNAKVIMLNRNPQKTEDCISIIKKELGNNVDISFFRIDLGNQLSIKSAVLEILEKVERIDALICNGAIAQVPKRQLTVDGHESQLGVNYYGHFTLQALLYPLIEKSNGRIVTVGSMGYDMGLKTIKFEDLNWEKNYTANDAYSQSKLAQIMSIYELQDRLKAAKKNNVKAYACHPGSSRTSLITTSGSFIMRIIFALMKFSPLTQPAKNGAYPELMCALEENLNESCFYGPTGWNYWVGPVGECNLKSHAVDKVISKKLWDLSEKITGINWDI